MNLIDKLTQKNHSSQELRDIISQHLKSLFENADWNYSSELKDYKRYYTQSAQQQLLETIRIELTALLNLEHSGFYPFFGGLSDYYSKEVVALTQYDFEDNPPTNNLTSQNSKASLALAKSRASNSSKHESKKPVSIYFNNNSFFNKIKNSINNGARCLPPDIMEIIAEYAMNGHDAHLLNKTIDTITNLNLKIPQLLCASQSNEEGLNSMIKLIDDSLTTLIQLYGNKESKMETAKLMYFGLSNYSIKDSPLHILSSDQQEFLCEITRILFYLLDWDNVPYPSHPFRDKLTGMQITIYALKAHIELPGSNDLIPKLFEFFFDYALPLLPPKINNDDLEGTYIGPIDTLGSQLYNCFLYHKYDTFLQSSLKKSILININKQNYLGILTDILESSLDPLKQFALIERIWKMAHYTYRYSPKELIMFLSAHAKRGNIAASCWITTAEQHGIHLLSNNKLSEVYKDIAMDDLFQFIANATQLNFGFTHSELPSFAICLANYLAQYDEKNLIKNILNYFSENYKPTDFLSIKIMSSFLRGIKDCHPELMAQFIPIQTSLIEALSNLQSNEDVNPICRNSKVFEDMIQEVSALIEGDVRDIAIGMHC